MQERSTNAEVDERLVLVFAEHHSERLARYMARKHTRCATYQKKET